ncbi:MAG TPA: hypothetical protein VD993_18000 [Chitinophagaceae bacterium]|nr:hypothetical protein [Chitinophagaceae bacterium]
MTIITVILLIAAAYLAAGLVFAVPFVLKGVTRVDEGAAGSGWGFRIIIIPGTVVFWPLLLKKWLRAKKVARSNKH